MVHVVCSNSPAGTGKTTIAALAGMYAVEAGEYDRLIYIRNAVAVRDIGFLPGSEAEKTEIFFEPMISALDLIQPGYFEKHSKPNPMSKQPVTVVARSTSFLRGVTFGRSFIIIDEAQNLSLHELRTTISRVTDDSKLVIIGSSNQIDNEKLKLIAGLTPMEVYFEHLRGYKTTYHKLERNYRGELSLLADQVDETVKRLKAM
jgi:PhoH-like ATPase